MKKINEKLIVLLILGLLVHQHQVHCFFTMALSLIQFAWTAFEAADSVHDTYTKITTPSTTDLMEKSEEIAKSLDEWGGRIEEKIQQSVDLLLTRLPLMGEISADVRLLNGYVGRIGVLYKDYRYYLEHADGYDEDSLKALIDVFMSRKAGDVQDVIESMYNLLVPEGLSSMKKSLFVLLAQEAKELTLDVCDTNGSPQQRLVQFYDILMEVEMRAFTMSIFGHKMDGYLRNVSRTSAMELLRDKLLERARQYPKILKNTIGLAPTVFRKCDPPEGHERGVTYLEFEKFMTGFIIPEQSFRGNEQCSKTCEAYSEPTESVKCKGDMCPGGDHACVGQLAECSTMAEGVSYCLNDASEARRFEWFKDKDHTYGDDSKGCSGEIRRDQGELYRGQRCDMCRCICTEGFTLSGVNHYISTRDQMSDVRNNMVVTGVRFVMQNRILFVQVRQGKLGPNAEIIRDSTSWVELEYFYLNEEMSERMRMPFFNMKLPDGYSAEMGSKGVFTLNRQNKRINLDFLSAPKDHVITGVKLESDYNYGSESIQLKIRVTKFDPETGELDLKSNRMIGPNDMAYARKKGATRRYHWKVEGKRNPAQSRATRIDSTPYSSIDLGYSSMEYDAAQTVIPLIDAIPVITEPPTPIVSVGLYHKKQSGYGGFLTFVLEGTNMATYMPTDI